MKKSRLNLYRWILMFLSPALVIIMVYFIEQDEYMTGNTESAKYFFLYILFVFLWMISTGVLLGIFIYSRKTISAGIRKFLIVFMPASLFIYLFFRIFPSLIVSSESVYYFIFGFIYAIIISIILVFISYLDKLEFILLGLIPVIIFGFIINRFGLVEGEVIIPFAFFLSSVGFIILIFQSVAIFKSERTKGMFFIVFYSVLACLNSLFLIKFVSARPALSSLYDTIGVVIFLMACLAMFIILPFSNFTEWTKTQKLTFKRVIITPLIMFLIIFSLKFLLPDKIYRNIFFMEYSQKERVHFNMEDYVIK